MRRLFLACVLFSVAALLLGSQRPPWRARRRPDAPLPNRLADARVKPEDWGREPEPPAKIDPARFATALSELCAQPNARRARSLGDAVLATGNEHALDPFLLAALAFRGSYCRSDYDDPLGVGLTALPVGMYQHDFRKGSYLYRVRQSAGWAERERPLKRFPFIPAILQRTEGNLYFAASLLDVWREQHATVDEHFPQVPHRHFVSHWFWGDRVKSARDEDRLFTDRRRLLGYYGAAGPAPTTVFRGVTLGSPLDGAPRVVSSGLGFARDEGRSHRGIDVESDYGEPVRAIADGLVVFSGVDLPGQKNHVQLEVEQTNAYPRGELGHGGRYVCIQHPTPPGQGKPLRSCSMHLETVDVAYGAKVQRGDRIGRVGRTGVKSSPPHLHLELFALDELLDPLPALRGPLIGTPVELEP